MSSPFLYSSAIAAQTNLSTTRSDSHDRSPTSSNTFSPAVIAVIGILGAAFLLVSYYTMVAKFCTSRRGHGFFGRSRQIRRNANINDLLLDMANNGEQIVWPSFPQRGLSDGEIEKLPVIEYRKTSLSSPSSSSSSSSSSDEDSMSKSMAKDLSRTMQGKPPDQIPPKACIGMRLSYIDEEGKTAVETSVLNEEGKLAMETSLPDDKGGKLAMMKTLPVVDEGGKVAMETSPVDTAEEDKSMIMSSEERKSLRVCDNQIVVCGSSDCAVCLCEFEDGEMVRVLPRCGHGFHFGCIYMWLHSHPNCPVCRTHVLTNPESSADDSEILPPLEDQDLIHDPTSIISTAHSSPNPDLQPLHIIDEGEAEDVDDDGQQLVRLRPQNHEQKKITDSSYNMKENRDLPMAADQVEHDTNVWDLGLGLELRCFSASRASMSRFVGSHEDDEDHKGLGFDDTERGVIRRSRSLIFHIGHNGSLNVQTHGRQDRVHTTVDIKKLITSSSSSSSVPLSSSSSLVPSSSSSLVPSSSSSLVPSSSSSSSSLVPLSSSSLVPSSSSSLVPSSSSSLIPSCLPISVRPSDATHHDDATAAASIMRDDYKSKSFNSNYEDEMKTLGSDPFMARMAHSLRCTRVVRRSFSGGKLFGFKGAQQRSTSSSSSNSEAIPPRLPI